MLGTSVRNVSGAFVRKIRLPQAPRRSRSHSLLPGLPLGPIPCGVRRGEARGAGAGRRRLCHCSPAGGNSPSGIERETGLSPPGLPLTPDPRLLAETRLIHFLD